MFIIVDDSEILEQIEGWKYTNQDGDVETVEIDDADYVTLTDSTYSQSHIYFSDIPKLIKALQCAYNWSKGEVY